MGKRLVLVKEHWPSVPGHPEVYKSWIAKVYGETDTMMIVKRHWYNKKRQVPINGMFLKVEELREDS